MKTYQVTPELAGFDRRRTLLRMLMAGVLFAAMQMLLSILWPFSAPTHWPGDFIRPIIGGVIFGPLFVLLMRRMLTYKVDVSADCITSTRSGFRRSVRRGEAKTITETSGSALVAPALRISKHGRLGTWFWGCIWIPKAVPEYEYVRDLVISWKAGLQV